MWKAIHSFGMGFIIGAALARLLLISFGAKVYPDWIFALVILILSTIITVTYFKIKDEDYKSWTKTISNLRR